MNIYILIFSLLCIAGCKQTTATHADEASISASDPCDDPDADIHCSFENMPVEISSVVQISGKNEPGEKMIITGTLFQPDGKTPFRDVIMYVYHTDNKGYYSKSGNEKGIQKWHGKLHGWLKTNSSGQYQIRSIRPARYPQNLFPAHIHAVIKEPGKEPYHISDFVFADDSLVNEAYVSSIRSLPGGTGVVELKNEDGTWTGTRDIFLK